MINSKTTNWLRFNISFSYPNFKFERPDPIFNFFLLWLKIKRWLFVVLLNYRLDNIMLIFKATPRPNVDMLLIMKNGFYETTWFFFINRVSKSSMFDTGVESCLLISSFSFIDFLTTDKFLKSGFVLNVRPTSLEWHYNIKLC